MGERDVSIAVWVRMYRLDNFMLKRLENQRRQRDLYAVSRTYSGLFTKFGENQHSLKIFLCERPFAEKVKEALS